MPLRVATWNLFHGRSVPPTHANLLPAFATALAAHPWDVVGLQEVPPWWAAELGARLSARVRSTRTSYLRATAAGLQQAIHGRDPEVLGVRGAAANVLLVRPDAGTITAHRHATLRWLPQRRALHGVRLARPDGTATWVCNVHTHNHPRAAAADLRRALRIARAWAGDEPLVLLGDLNLPAPVVAAAGALQQCFGHRVDHILARGLVDAGASFAARIQPAAGVTLSDHRLVGTRLVRP